jgi:hypothetical protein
MHDAHSDSAHPHVHGANLGMRGSAYLRAGGFRSLASAEDHALLAALASSGGRIISVTDIPVVTSSRRRGRAPDGFSHLLARLGASTQAHA